MKGMISILPILEEINMVIILEMHTLNIMDLAMMITMQTMRSIRMIIMVMLMEIIMDQHIMIIMKHMVITMNLEVITIMDILLFRSCTRFACFLVQLNSKWANIMITLPHSTLVPHPLSSSYWINELINK